MGQWGSVYERIISRVILGLCLLLFSPVLAQHAEGAWVGEFRELNPQLTESDVAAHALVAIKDNRLHVSLLASGLPAGMRLAHIHGFVNNDAAHCPDETADANGDGIVDLLETEEVAGTTLIPFHFELAKVDVLESDTYPEASEEGGILVYSASTSADRLASALADNFSIVHWDLGSRVIFIHGAAEGVELPDTVQSLPGVPAEATVPIACAELKEL